MFRAVCLVVAVAAVPLSGCTDGCPLVVNNETGVEITSVYTRLEGSTVWPDDDRLTGRIRVDSTRRTSLPDSAPWFLDVRFVDADDGTYSLYSQIRCAAPAKVEVTIDAGDLDERCDWTLTNDTTDDLVSVRLRRAGTDVWTREAFDLPLAPGETATWGLGDSPQVWDLQALTEDGSAYTRLDAGRCENGSPITSALTDADAGEGS